MQPVPGKVKQKSNIPALFMGVSAKRPRQTTDRNYRTESAARCFCLNLPITPAGYFQEIQWQIADLCVCVSPSLYLPAAWRHIDQGITPNCLGEILPCLSWWTGACIVCLWRREGRVGYLTSRSNFLPPLSVHDVWPRMLAENIVP